MPPQQARSIASYFAKTPTKVAQTAALSSTTKTVQNGLPSSLKPDESGAGPASPKLSNAPPAALQPSSPLTGPGSDSKKRSFLSDAAKKAIEDGAASRPVVPESEQASKKMKPNPANGNVADVFKKASNPSAYKPLAVAKCSTRDELRKTLADHPRTAELLATELDTMGEDWLLALQEEFTKPYFMSLKEFVTGEQAKKRVFPPAQDIYSWSTLCPLKDVRVVIIGEFDYKIKSQDPYHDDGQAHGLAFSVRKGMRIPPSLRNIYKQMADEIPGFIIPKHGDLTDWAKHGVLLLNTALTVRAHEAASHSNKGWEQFTAAVLRVVTQRLSPTGGDHLPGANGVCFMAWGAHAQKMCAGVDTKKHLILKSAHPSPLAAARGFFGNQHFSKANTWLEERYGPGGGIDWASLGSGS